MHTQIAKHAIIHLHKFLIGIVPLFLISCAGVESNQLDGLLGTWQLDSVRTVLARLEPISVAQLEGINEEELDTIRSGIRERAPIVDAQMTIIFEEKEMTIVSTREGRKVIPFRVIEGAADFVVIETTDQTGLKTTRKIRVVENGLALEQSDSRSINEQSERGTNNDSVIAFGIVGNTTNTQNKSPERPSGPLLIFLKRVNVDQ